MKLEDCLKLGKDCGLKTVGESFYNIKIHAANFFIYDNITEELQEIVNEIDRLQLKPDMLIEEVTL